MRITRRKRGYRAKTLTPSTPTQHPINGKYSGDLEQKGSPRDSNPRVEQKQVGEPLLYRWATLPENILFGWCCVGVLGVRVYALQPLSRRESLIFLSLGEGFPLNFDILFRGYPLFFLTILRF